MAVGHEFDVFDTEILAELSLKLFVFCAHVCEPVGGEYGLDFLYVFFKWWD